MPNYFKNFPRVDYHTRQIVDITRRAKVLDKYRNDPNLYLPYTVTEDDKPEDIAYYYYGSTDYVWLVFLANNIIDHYSDWPKTDEVFDEFLKVKYEYQYRASTGDQTEDLDDEVFYWTQNATITDNILHFNGVFSTGEEIQLSKESYERLAYVELGYEVESENYSVPTFTDDQDSGMLWEAYRFYDYEYDRNQSLRTINLINNSFDPQLQNELKSLMKNVRN